MPEAAAFPMASARFGEYMFTHTIDGVGVTSGQTLEVIDPSTAKAFALCPAASGEQLDQAVAAAAGAASSWAALGYAARRQYLGELAAALRAEVDSLATLLTTEQGKPIAQAKAEVQKGADALEQVANLVVDEELLRAEGPIELVYRPLGVVGIISPWNMPVGLALSRMGPALYAGNTVVLKPSPFTPLTTLRVGEITRSVLPRGVVNVIAGGDDLGRRMTEHGAIQKISFTGSVATGKLVMASAAGSVKRVTLELGGNDPAIVLEDVDVEKVASEIFWGAFRNSGQICMAIKRVYVHESIYEAMVAALGKLVCGVRMGSGFDPGVELGPLQNAMQFGLTKAMLQDTSMLPGVRLISRSVPLPAEGYFVQPTIVADIEDGTRLVDEEQFAPLLPIVKFDSLEDVIDRVNRGRYGLSASVWSKDPGRAREVAMRLDVGTTWINTHMVTDIAVPFGGCKQSGVGCENSILGLKSYLQAHVIHTAPARPD